MKLVVALGNPGAEYAHTRHNAGRLMIDLFCASQNIHGRKMEKSFAAEITKVWDTIYAKPQTYMNKSGEAVKKICDFYKILPEDILVLHDEIDLPTGKIQKKIGGSHAWHNGLKSILLHLGGINTFTRLRIGVDRPATREEVVDWVLGKFSQEEWKKLEEQEGMVNEMVWGWSE
jgi:peptidyl-tRNA hydrolase, PTH1 family